MELRSITILLTVLLCLISFTNGKLFGSSALNYPWDENQIESSSSNEVSNSEDDDIINRKFEEMNDLPLGTPEEVSFLVYFCSKIIFEFRECFFH